MTEDKRLFLILCGLFLFLSILYNSNYAFSETINKKCLEVKINLDWFSCSNQLDVLTQLLENNSENDVIRLSNILIDESWGKDKILYYLIAYSEYLLGNTDDAIIYLEKSINSYNYHCFVASPGPRGLILKEAEDRYVLSQLYLENRRIDDSQKQKKISIKLARKYFGEKFNDDMYRTYVESSKFVHNLK